MLTQEHIAILNEALNALEQINKRARNNSKSPQFIPIYDKILADIAETRILVTKLAPKTK